MGKSKTDQISVDNIPTRDDSYSRINSSMFIEDIAFSRYRIKKEYLSITVENQNPKEVIEFLTNSISIFRYRNQWGESSSLEDTILDLIEYISDRIANSGYCIFEIIKGDDISSSLKVIQGNVQVKNKEVIQLVPNEVAQKLKCKTKISIPRKKCFLVEFPKIICSSKQYKKILKEMGEIDNKDPLYSILSPSNLSKVEGYDPMKHRTKLDLILRRITRDTSWHHREHFSSRDTFSSYYTTLRSLKFNRTKIILLNHITNNIEAIVESTFGRPVLKIQYGKTLTDIDEIIKNYENGEFNHDLHMKIIQEYSI